MFAFVPFCSMFSIALSIAESIDSRSLRVIYTWKDGFYLTKRVWLLHKARQRGKRDDPVVVKGPHIPPPNLRVTGEQCEITKV